MATREGSWGHRGAPLLGQFKGTPMLGRLWEKRGCRPQSWVNLRVPRCWASFGVLGVQRCPKIGGGESLGVTAGQRRCPKLQDKDGVLETCGCWVNPGGQGGGLGLGWGPGVGVGVGCFLGWGALTGALAGRFGAVDGAGVELIEPRLQEGHGHGGRQPGQALPQRRALPAGTRGHGAGTRPHNHRPTPGSPRGGGGGPAPPLLTSPRRGSAWCPESKCCTGCGNTRPGRRPLREGTDPTASPQCPHGPKVSLFCPQLSPHGPGVPRAQRVPSCPQSVPSCPRNPKCVPVPKTLPGVFKCPHVPTVPVPKVPMSP